MEKYKEKLTVITRDRQTRQNIINKIERLEKQKTLLSLEIETRSKDLLKEQDELNALEKITLSSVVNAILKSKMEKLAKEKEQYYVECLKYERQKDELSRITREHEHLKNALKDFDTVEEDYQALLFDIRERIQKNNIGEAEKLDGLLEQRDLFEKEHLALKEALMESEEVLEQLHVAKKYLKKAKEWGEYDLSGGGLVATMKEFEYLDEAQELLHHIQWGIRKFHNALDTLGVHQDMEIKRILSVSDYWLNGVFKDYSLQSAIIKLMDSMNKLIVEILKIDERLRQEELKNITKKENMQVALDHFFDRINIG